VACIAIVSRVVSASCILAIATLGDAHADPLDAATSSWHEKTSVDAEPAFESWIGVEGYRHVTSLYSGITWSPFSNLRQDGLRLRLVSGISTYRYAGWRYDPALGANSWQQFSGSARFLDLMAGWQFSHQGTTVKAFIGYEQQSHLIAPFDPDTLIQGGASGIKGALEIWQNWTPTLWSSLDVSMARAHATYDVKLRTGWRTDANWSFGPEISVVGHSESSLQRAGLFGRYENLEHEFTISAGVSAARGNTPSGYGAAQYLRRF